MTTDRPGGGSQSDRPRRRELDSPVVTKTVRLLTPFVVTLGLFTMFHGTSSVGGGFQGGVIVAAALITVAFAFGIDQTRQWLDAAWLTGAAVSGILVFAAIATGALVFDRVYLDLTAYPVPKAVVYAIELVELGIGATVAATILVMFLALARGESG
ncbi:MnhB domain-containing protein [Halorientalis brevis]|uniref:MnhB domain-containing protein n=1 Tax=Halorientalis brevis TaxID=1126241 RepID=A0ABD6CGR4_9EURY|nr:MnhB domain-containing protein [Halorientalis brevis]